MASPWPAVRRFAADVVRFAGPAGAIAVLLALGTALVEAVALALVAPLLALLAAAPLPGRLVPSVLAAIGIATPFAQLAAVLSLIGLLWIARSALACARDARLGAISVDFAEAQRRRIVTRLAAADWAQVAALRHARIVQALGPDVMRIGLATQMLIQLAVAVVMLVAFAAVALMLAPMLAAIALLLLGAVGLALALLLRRTHDIGTLAVRANQALADASARFLGGLRLAASQNLQPSFLARFEQGLAEVRDQQAQYIRQQNSARLGISGAALAVGAVVALVGRGWLDTPLPQLGALILVLSRLGGPVSQIQAALQQLVFALPSYAELDGLAVQIAPAPVPDGQAPTLPVGATIQIEQVRFAHATRGGALAEAPVLDNVSLTLAPGEIVGLTGASGAGKSTLADILVGLLTPQAGVVRLGTVPLVGAAASAWRERIAYAAQEPYLFHASVRDNLMWGARAADGAALEEALWRALDAASAADLVRGLPHGLATIVGERGALLSGGERQRLALARALLRGGDLLVLDEATSALDTATEARIFARLRVQAAGRATLVIAHRAETLNYCDRVVRLEAGRLVPYPLNTDQ